MRSVLKFLKNPPAFLKQKKQQKLEQSLAQLQKSLKHQISCAVLYQMQQFSFSIMEKDNSISTNIPKDFLVLKYIENADLIVGSCNNQEAVFVLFQNMKPVASIAINRTKNKFTAIENEWFKLAELSGERLMNAQCYS
jgi:hypothetical protein